MRPIHRKSVTVIAALLLASSSCRSIPRGRGAEARVHHVVICWLKEPGSLAARNEVIQASEDLREIPGVVDLHAGPVLPDARPTTDSSFDVALIITFDSEASLRSYPQHPLHQKIVREIIKPRVARYIAYDWQENPGPSHVPKNEDGW